MKPSDSTKRNNKGSERGGHANLGKLHDLLVKGLPDYKYEGGFNAKGVAGDLGISPQAIYKWFERESISPNRIKQLVSLSEKTLNRGENFVALKRDDFWPFIS
jgi:hypothetical protein